MQLLRKQGCGAEVLGDAGQGREPAVAGDDEGAHLQRADRRLGGARVLRAAAGMAQAAERRPGLRLAGAGAAGGGSRDGRKATGRLTCTRAGPLATARRRAGLARGTPRSEEPTTELQALMR